MANSNPSIQSVDVPEEVPPNDTFTVDVTVRQGDGPDPWLSTGGCTSRNLDVSAWTTPVSLWVDGALKDTRELCLANNNSRETTFSLSLSEGSHTVEVAVHQVGDVVPLGESWEDNLEATRHDDIRAQIVTSTEARDPSRPDAGEKVTRFFERIADSLGTTTTQVGLGIAIAVVILVVI